MPMFLVKERKPLGHSGQRKLQDVVGSIEIENGKPNWIGFFRNLLK